jgi:hypothetical protein
MGASLPNSHVNQVTWDMRPSRKTGWPVTSFQSFSTSKSQIPPRDGPIINPGWLEKIAGKTVK